MRDNRSVEHKASLEANGLYCQISSEIVSFCGAELFSPGRTWLGKAPRGHFSQYVPVLQGVFVNLNHIVQIGTPGIGEPASVFLSILSHDFQVFLFNPQLVEACNKAAAKALADALRKRFPDAPQVMEL